MGNISAPLLAELEHEAATTRKYLERIPDDKFAWTPHAKSMPLGRLATHVAEIPGWTNETMTLTLLDFDTGDYKANVCANRAEVLALFDKDVARAKAILAGGGDTRTPVASPGSPVDAPSALDAIEPTVEQS